jgi:thiamine-monophosphate kinase
MPLNEFSLIEHYFATVGHAEGVVLGVGDDGALLDVPTGHHLVVSVDTLVAGVHFPQDAAADDIAHRALRVNLSDFAAMGATPRWFTLALTLPGADMAWLAAFSRALAMDAEQFGCVLVGGDTTAGPLSISIQLMGLVPTGRALTRSGARAGDHVYVTGTLGEGAAALRLFEPSVKLTGAVREQLKERFYQPTPRLQEGLALRGLASAALDVSDGLLADLGHIAEQSALGAELQLSVLPVAPWLKKLADAGTVQDWVLSGGDDYELCFTVPTENLAAIDGMIAKGKLIATCIGRMTTTTGVRCIDDNGKLVPVGQTGYRHF